MKLSEDDFRIEGHKAIYIPEGWEIWLDTQEAGRPRRVHWSLPRPAQSHYEEQVKITAALLLEKRGS